MRIIFAIIAALAIMSSATGQSVAGHAPSSCANGSAPDGWHRAGGYCSIAERGPQRVTKKAKCSAGYDFDPVLKECVPE